MNSPQTVLFIYMVLYLQKVGPLLSFSTYALHLANEPKDKEIIFWAQEEGGDRGYIKHLV